MTRGRLILLVKLGIAAGLFAWLISSGRIEAESFSQLGRSWPWFAAGASLYGIVLILAALRWRLLLG
ncbi:MAG TPA: hypothetical protein VK116_13645, partial [Planctomycetota bacterium]|nr:hypothetical protein [Planctomycetota bacterium]